MMFGCFVFLKFLYLFLDNMVVMFVILDWVILFFVSDIEVFKEVLVFIGVLGVVEIFFVVLRLDGL